MTDFKLSCPPTIVTEETIQMPHGGGGTWMHRLLEDLFFRQFSNPLLDTRHDGAVFQFGGARLAFTTDSYVVRPLIFPGGDIGSLAVNGTVNDLAMCGARPLHLSAAFILEEGLAIETLRRVAASVATAARRAGVLIATGDTKVVDKGKGDGIFINTAGIGVVEHDLQIAPAQIAPGDAILLSGDLGRHGLAILSVREGLELEGCISSDTAPLWPPVESLLKGGIRIRCMRDATRGGLSSALNEIARTRGVGLRVRERQIPIEEAVSNGCEILGLDPLYVANEGRFVAFVPEEQAEQAAAILRGHPDCANASIIGRVVPENPGTVTLETRIGGNRVIDMLSGDPLPRIC